MRIELKKDVPSWSVFPGIVPRAKFKEHRLPPLIPYRYLCRLISYDIHPAVHLVHHEPPGYAGQAQSPVCDEIRLR